MSHQLIFVVETNKKCQSDWMYIKDTIDRFYKYDKGKLKLSVVYMDGKGRYKNKEKEIKRLKEQYSLSSADNKSNVIFCFDCDDYDVKPEDREFLANVSRYCHDNNYDFVWFCKDIERVYLGKKIDDKNKKREAAGFISKRLIETIDENILTADSYRANTSNILKVIDEYLERK